MKFLNLQQFIYRYEWIRNWVNNIHQREKNVKKKKNSNCLNVLPLLLTTKPADPPPPQCAVIYGILSPLSLSFSLSMTESPPCIEGKLSPDIYHNLAVILWASNFTSSFAAVERLTHVLCVFCYQLWFFLSFGKLTNIELAL